MSEAFDPSRCDLCGETAREELVHLKTGRALRSDRVVLATDLWKVACARCGLVRDGQGRSAAEVGDYYAREYTLGAAPADYVFHTSRGPVARGQALADWLVAFGGEARFRKARRGVELGAGAGYVLGALRARFPGVDLSGVEPGAAAIAHAGARGVPVGPGTPEDLPAAAFDLAWSVAVVEHVGSPLAFLREIRRTLVPGGFLLLCQPTQDVASYDVFFTDHLHHFGSSHLRAYARAAGFVERGFKVGHEFMPNFSIHLWEATEEVPPAAAWSGPPGPTTCAETVARVRGDMERLDALLADRAARGRKVAVFGLNEVFALARAYSTLGSFPLVCGLVDGEPPPEAAGLPFPVVAPERARELGVEDAIVAVNRVWLEAVVRRLERLDVVGYPILSDAPVPIPRA